MIFLINVYNNDLTNNPASELESNIIQCSLHVLYQLTR